MLNFDYLEKGLGNSRISCLVFTFKSVQFLSKTGQIATAD